jgi:hypothetical protein
MNNAKINAKFGVNGVENNINGVGGRTKQWEITGRKTATNY